MSLWSFFLTIFKISSITFGGGYTIVPVIREEFVCKRGLLTDEEMLDLIALAQSAPGPIAVGTALLTGYKLKGRVGALLGVLAAILPPLIIISIFFYIYKAWVDNFWVRSALRGMSGAISAVMILAVIDLAKAGLKEHKVFSLGLMVTSFAVGYFSSLNSGLIILALGLAGLLAFTFIPEEKIP